MVYNSPNNLTKLYRLSWKVGASILQVAELRIPRTNHERIQVDDKVERCIWERSQKRVNIELYTRKLINSLVTAFVAKLLSATRFCSCDNGGGTQTTIIFVNMMKDISSRMMAVHTRVGIVGIILAWKVMVVICIRKILVPLLMCILSKHQSQRSFRQFFFQ